MATDAVVVPASSRPHTYKPVNRTAERIFYSAMALLLCICVYIGFSPTYFRAGIVRAPLPSPILHIHGAIFTLWMLLFVVQVYFACILVPNGTHYADGTAANNAFYNLVNNAISEVPSGGSVTILGEVAKTAQVLDISVTDTGRGMPPEIRDSLFTARAISRKSGGTGLGTKIVKDVVDAHKGHINVESTVGVGTTFRLILPLKQIKTGQS